MASGYRIRRPFQNRGTLAVGDGRQEVWATVLRSGSSLCTIASGGSIGREGAMVHWPQLPVPGLGSWAASRATNYASLLACGAAAGFASAYDAALSGAIFMAELVYGTLVIRRQFPSPHRTAAKLRPIRSACLIRVLTPGV